MKCRLVHGVRGRVRVRFDDAQLFRDHLPGLAVFLRDLPGVSDVRLSPACRCAILLYDPDATGPQALVDLINNKLVPDPTANMQAAARCMHTHAAGSISWLPLALSTAAAGLAVAGGSSLVPWFLLGAAVPIFKRAFNTVVHKRRLNVDVLDASATALLVSRGRFVSSAIMVWLVSVGDFLRDFTRQRSIETVRGLYSQRDAFAWVIRGTRRLRVKAQDVCKGDDLVVYPGELVPVDGTVTAGEGTVDQKMLTGESMPVAKCEGDEVYAGTVVAEGKLYLKAERVGEQTRASEIVRQILDTPVGDTRAQNYAERFADRLVPFSFLAAGGSMVATATVDMAASLLIVDFGTGMRVSAPTTVLASIAKAARQGFHIKGGRYLELLAEVDAVVFDKTGTLTAGAAQVLEVIPYGRSARADKVLALAAAAGARLNHPVARAIVGEAAKRSVVAPEREASDYTIGKGVEAIVGGSKVLVGNAAQMASRQVDVAPASADVSRADERGESSLFVAVDGVLVGLLIYSDPVRPEAADVVQALRERGVGEILLLTGDSRPVAMTIARAVGIERYVANALPDQKVEIVKALQQEGLTVAVVGDGINDSPALVQADVGIAVHNGSDVARETAHVTLHDETLWQIPQAIDLARESMRLIRQNWHINLYPNSVAIALAVLGVLGPIGATIISNGAAVVATANSLRPLLSAKRSEQRCDGMLKRKLHQVPGDVRR